MTKRFLVIRFAEEEGLGTIAEWCKQNSIITVYTNLYAGVSCPVNAGLMYDGLIFMGGPQSVNDKTDIMKGALHTTESFLKSNKPVLGICLGSQAIAKVAGATVSKSAFEFGFHKVKPMANEAVFAEPDYLREDWDVFQWHGENFTLPPSARLLFEGNVVQNQGFIMGKAIGLQFHNELSPEWYEMWRISIADKHNDERLRMEKATTDMPFQKMKQNLFGLLSGWKKSW